jgi:hypothetical protein
MTQIAFTTAQSISDQKLDYLASQVLSLSRQDEFSINNYIDSELTNPDVHEYLQTHADDLKTELQDNNNFSLTFHEEMLVRSGIGDFLKKLFGGLKRKVTKIFCQVVGDMQKDTSIDVKGIIKAVLLALIPAFATGIPAAVLPIVIGLAALLLKYGYSKVCPI